MLILQVDADTRFVDYNKIVDVCQLRPGDRLFTTDGRYATIHRISTSQTQTVTLCLQDGRNLRVPYQTFVDCRILSSGDCAAPKSLRAEDVFSRIGIQKRNTYCQSRRFFPTLEDREFLIDPYWVGAMLGDGTLIRGNLKIATDIEIQERMLKTMPSSFRIKQKCQIKTCVKSNFVSDNPKDYRRWNDELVRLKLCGCTAIDKFIPEEYLVCSVSQRLALLQGLMDTDGAGSATGGTSYSTISEQLASDMQRLIRSLGGLCALSRFDIPSEQDSKIVARHPYYLCKIRYPDYQEIFYLPRKKRLHVGKSGYSKYRIELAEEQGTTVDSVVMELDQPGAFLTDSGIALCT